MASGNKNKNNNENNEKIDLKASEQIKEVSPWVERIGVYVVGLMTTLGLALIMYTGVRAATFNPVTDVPELLTHEDILSNTDNDNANTNDDDDAVNEDNDEETDNKDDDETDHKDSDDEEDADEETDADEDDDADEDADTDSSGIRGVANSNANIRKAPQADDSTEIIAQLSKGDTIKILDADYSNIWIKVEYDGEIGYVSRSLIDLAE